MPQGVQDDHESLPPHSVEIEPGATPTATGGERARMMIGAVGATLKDVSDELQGQAHPEAAEQIRAFRGRLLVLLEAERTQIILMGALGVNLLFLMFELLTDCHIVDHEGDPTCFDGLLHSLSMIIVVVFAVEKLMLVYCLRGEFFKNPYYAMDLGCVSAALVLGWLLTTDAFSLLLLSRSWRVANVVSRMAQRQPDLTELVDQSVTSATRDLEARNQSLDSRVQELERANRALEQENRRLAESRFEPKTQRRAPAPEPAPSGRTPGGAGPSSYSREDASSRKPLV